MCKDFIPILEHPSLVFFKEEKVFLYWPYSDNSDAVFTVIKPELCGSVSKDFQNLISFILFHLVRNNFITCQC